MAEFTHEFFEESSREFMKGKVRHGHMIYYMCSAILKNGKPCSRRAIQDPLVDRVCSQHRAKIEKPKPALACRKANAECYKRSSERLAQRPT